MVCHTLRKSVAYPKLIINGSKIEGDNFNFLGMMFNTNLLIWPIQRLYLTSRAIGVNN